MLQILEFMKVEPQIKKVTGYKRRKRIYKYKISVTLDSLACLKVCQNIWRYAIKYRTNTHMVLV